MGIKIEFNPDLALRDCSEFENGNRKEDECIPKNLIAGQIYHFLKEGQRNYWLEGELPLVETKGDQQLSRPIASIRILEVVHFMQDGRPFTKGKYQVIEVFDQANHQPHFDGFTRI